MTSEKKLGDSVTDRDIERSFLHLPPPAECVIVTSCHLPNQLELMVLIMYLCKSVVLIHIIVYLW